MFRPMFPLGWGRQSDEVIKARLEAKTLGLAVVLMALVLLVFVVLSWPKECAMFVGKILDILAKFSAKA